MRFDPINITLDRSTNVYIQSKKALGLSSSDHTDWIIAINLSRPRFHHWRTRTWFSSTSPVWISRAMFTWWAASMQQTLLLSHWIVVTSTHELKYPSQTFNNTRSINLFVYSGRMRSQNWKKLDSKFKLWHTVLIICIFENIAHSNTFLNWWLNNKTTVVRS